jgi:hypothetical protein
MSVKALLFAYLATKLVVFAADHEDSPSAVNNKDSPTVDANEARAPTVDLDKLPAEYGRYHGLEKLWQRVYNHGAGCYRGEITVTWKENPVHVPGDDADLCHKACHGTVARDISPKDFAVRTKRCLAGQRPNFQLLSAVSVDTVCEGQKMVSCICSGMFNQTNIIKPKSELRQGKRKRWPAGQPYYPKGCEMENIGKHFAGHLPHKTVSAVRKENNDCPQLRQDHPVIENFERDLGRLTKDQLSKIERRAIYLSKKRSHQSTRQLPDDHPRKVNFKAGESRRSRKSYEKRKLMCRDKTLQSRKQDKRPKTGHEYGETSRPGDEPFDQQICSAADIGMADFPREDLRPFETLLPREILDLPPAENDIDLLALLPVRESQNEIDLNEYPKDIDSNKDPRGLDLNEHPEDEDDEL